MFSFRCRFNIFFIGISIIHTADICFAMETNNYNNIDELLITENFSFLETVLLDQTIELQVEKQKEEIITIELIKKIKKSSSSSSLLKKLSCSKKAKKESSEHEVDDECHEEEKEEEEIEENENDQEREEETNEEDIEKECTDKEREEEKEEENDDEDDDKHKVLNDVKAVLLSLCTTDKERELVKKLTYAQARNLLKIMLS